MLRCRSRILPEVSMVPCPNRPVGFLFLMIAMNALLRRRMAHNTGLVSAFGVRPSRRRLGLDAALPRPLTPLIMPQSTEHPRRIQQKWKLFSTANDSSSSAPFPEPMSSLYHEWSIDQDRLLHEHRQESLPTLASLLGRGLKGVESRLAKLSDVNSPAYERLFAGRTKSDDTGKATSKLVPCREVLRRIQYDMSLSMSDFTVLHYDRVEDQVVESPMDAPNESIAGPEKQLVLALPEHRVVAIKYKERIVWDREQRIDRVFGSVGSYGETIDGVITTYEEWKRNEDAIERWNREKQAMVSNRIRQILGLQRFAELKEQSSILQETFVHAEGRLQKKDIEAYVQAALRLFRDARRDPSTSLEPSLIPTTDIDALYIFSELAALLPNVDLRKPILTEVSRRLEGTKGPSLDKYQLPNVDETDLTETFVRGSGAGGQKINKTSNRVVLVHEPTQLKVECQETRSLQQNRKIARKRLRMKVDEYLNGADSKASQKTKKAVQKKQKAKARSRARQRKKKTATSSE